MIVKFLKWLFDNRTAQDIKFEKARNAKAKRKLLEDAKRNADDHPTY